MRLISERKALTQLQRIKDAFAELIHNRYQHRAKSCATCETPGACCLDAHFVNVRIARLEAVAIGRRLNELSPAHREAVYLRIHDTIEEYGLSDQEDASLHTYACPLFGKRNWMLDP